MAGIVDTADSLGYLNSLESFLADQESFSATPYSDYKQSSIGYGTKADHDEGPITEDEALRRKRAHLESEVIPHIEREFPDLTNPQKIALGSLIYNVGWSAFSSSKAYDALKAGDNDAFLKEAFDPEVGFVNAGGKPVGGLVERRAQEAALFAMPILDGAQERSPIQEVPQSSQIESSPGGSPPTPRSPASQAAGIAAERPRAPTSKSAGIQGALQFTSSPQEAAERPQHMTSSSVSRPSTTSDGGGIAELRAPRMVPRNRSLQHAVDPETFFNLARQNVGFL